ncbi:MAG: AraC family transcriptional regulator [Pigmentiphaga sp.]|nr:AraC family transcriptional regulator [Pigmentiphaga sp.]
MERLSEGFKGERSIITPYSIRNFQLNNEFTSSLFITHIGYYPHAKYHFRERIDGAPENILILCDEGKGTIHYHNTVFNLKKNHVFIIPKQEQHAYQADRVNPWSIYWIHFKGVEEDLFSDILGRVIPLKNFRLQDRLSLFEEMLHNLEMGYNPNNLEYASICLKHFLATIKYQDQFAESYDNESEDIVQQSIYFMKQNLSGKIRLKEIANHIGYSTSHFSNLFKHKTSIPPMDYYNQLKIQKACSLLEFSNMKIKEIAYYLGFYDPFHFSKAFQDEMEISPKEYRKRYNLNSISYLTTP